MSVDINGLTDLALTSVGFFTIPDTAIAPYVNTYNYQISKAMSVNEAQIDNVSSMMRSSIRFPQGGLTSMQTKKLVVVISSALGMLGSGLLYMYAAPIIGIAGVIASIAIGIGFFVHYSYQYDLDSERERDSLSKKIGNWDFKQLSEVFTSDQLIRYDLLSRQLSCFNDKQKAGVYANIRNLYLDKNLLDEKQQQSIQTLHKTYKLGTKSLQEWIDSCRSRSLAVKWSELRTGPLNEQATNTAKQLMNSLLENKYNQMMNPWKAWENKESDSINEAYIDAINNLNTHYIRCMYGSGTVNAAGKIDPIALQDVMGVVLSKQPQSIPA